MILDASAIMFADVGYEATTMEAIAQKADTSIGSLYQFFPNKLAVFEALAVRCLDRSREMLDTLFATSAERPWTELLDTAIDGLGILRSVDPALRALVVNFQLYGVF